MPPQVTRFATILRLLPQGNPLRYYTVVGTAACRAGCSVYDTLTCIGTAARRAGCSVYSTVRKVESQAACLAGGAHLIWNHVNVPRGASRPAR